MYFNIPFLNIKVSIEKSIKPDKVMVPIGCDCHPAYFLKQLGAKKYKLPFDWMNISPQNGLTYVYENMNNNFAQFDKNLRKSGIQRYVAEKYPYAEFFHEKTSLLTERGMLRLNTKIKRLINVTTTKSCGFLYCAPASHFTSTDQVNNFITGLKKLISIIKRSDSLHLYIRYDEDETENEYHISNLLNRIEKIDNVFISKLVLLKSRNGVWGDQRSYLRLFRDLNIGTQNKTILKLKRNAKPKRTNNPLPDDGIQMLKTILIHVEDRRFYFHLGFDVIAIARAAVMNLKSRKIVQGGSTLTQQLARNLLNDMSVSFKRKISELVKAIEIEVKYSKDEILDLYINSVYFGPELRGFHAASRHFFSKELNALRIEEYMVLATLLRSPAYYSTNSKKLKDRFMVINEILMKANCISSLEYDRNKNYEIKIKESSTQSV